MVERYQKIPTVYLREEKRGGKLLVGQWASTEIAYLADCPWRFTEKVDGTNLRVIWDGHRVTYGGRTDDAQIPADLVNYLVGTFGGEENAQRLEQVFGSTPAMICGEGFGGRVAQGRHYAEASEMAVFDVKIGDWWLGRANVEDVAGKLDLTVVPEVLIGTLEEGVQLVREGFKSGWGEFLAEGVVGRPVVDLVARDGERIAVKLKRRDLA
ncbi:MAG TPA: RNA ligase family protein [Candidatus Methylomirabilis sp.]|nr:RNA ligase family protein [Candidatus Methylomirabilis sp.]